MTSMGRRRRHVSIGYESEDGDRKYKRAVTAATNDDSVVPARFWALAAVALLGGALAFHLQQANSPTPVTALAAVVACTLALLLGAWRGLGLKDGSAPTTYGPLVPTKWMHHDQVVRRVTTGRWKEMTPVTVHLALTLECNHRCYFCTYGGQKGSERAESAKPRAVDAHDKLHLDVMSMPQELMRSIVDQLADAGVRGVIITGGGEPTCHPGIVEAATHIKQRGMDFALNTNGSMFNKSLASKILRLNPTYVRFSLNSGSETVQELTTGKRNFARIVRNLKDAIRVKHECGAVTDISVGYVVNVVNLHDMKPFVGEMVRIEKELLAEGLPSTIFSLQFRPVSNYEGSKHFVASKVERVAAWLRSSSGPDYAAEFERFMFDGEQVSARTLDEALSTLEGSISTYLKRHQSAIRLVYPRRKFEDIPRLQHKAYERCMCTPLFLFIWPDGSTYPCVEWAGTPGFEIGDLSTTPLSDILRQQRAKVIDSINADVVHERCAIVCAHHELNEVLERVHKKDPEALRLLDDTRARAPPDHINFF